jgi:dienelactone hydrolase
MEAFAVHKPIQEVIDKLAREGYVALPPALYHRLGSHPLFSYTGEDAETRTKAMAGPRDAEQVPIMASTVMNARVLMPRLHKTPGGERSGGFSNT